jgi:hypothetical protein
MPLFLFIITGYYLLLLLEEDFDEESDDFDADPDELLPGCLSVANSAS